MSKSGSLKVKGLFKLKSPEKHSKEPKLSSSLNDGEPTETGPRERSRTFPTSPGPLSPGDPVALARDVQPFSPKTKKGLRLPFKMKRKKSKREDGGEVFFPATDELDSFSSHR